MIIYGERELIDTVKHKRTIISSSASHSDRGDYINIDIITESCDDGKVIGNSSYTKKAPKNFNINSYVLRKIADKATDVVFHELIVGEYFNVFSDRHFERIIMEVDKEIMKRRKLYE